ncbi:MAG: ROK family protein [Hominenteromicrobium sp.]
MNKLVFDIGATNIKFAVMTPEGAIVRRSSVPTPHDSLEHYLAALCALAEPETAGADGIAVSTNGRMDPDGDTYRAYTSSFLIGVNLREALESRLHLPAAVENDGLAAALGEWWKGAGRGTSNMLGVVLGSGMGSGLILNGKPYRGSTRNAAMAFGLLSVADPEKENYLASGISTAFPLVLYKTAAAKGLDPRSVTGPQVFAWAEAGDPVAAALLEQYYRSVAVSIYNSALLLDLDCVVLTGGLAAQKSLIQGVERNLKTIAQRALTLEGLDISALGVAIDYGDFNVKLRAGELNLDANLYGALYHLQTGC